MNRKYHKPRVINTEVLSSVSQSQHEVRRRRKHPRCLDSQAMNENFAPSRAEGPSRDISCSSWALTVLICQFEEANAHSSLTATKVVWFRTVFWWVLFSISRPISQYTKAVPDSRRARRPHVSSIQFIGGQRLACFYGLLPHCDRCWRSSRAPNSSLQNGQDRSIFGRPPERPATRLCADLIHWSDNVALQNGHRSQPSRYCKEQRFAIDISREVSSRGTTRYSTRKTKGNERRTSAPSSPKSRKTASLIRIYGSRSPLQTQGS
jgi:hypothetical protein